MEQKTPSGTVVGLELGAYDTRHHIGLRVIERIGPHLGYLPDTGETMDVSPGHVNSAALEEPGHVKLEGGADCADTGRSSTPDTSDNVYYRLVSSCSVNSEGQTVLDGWRPERCYSALPYCAPEDPLEGRRRVWVLRRTDDNPRRVSVQAEHVAKDEHDPFGGYSEELLSVPGSDAGPVFRLLTLAGFAFDDDSGDWLRSPSAPPRGGPPCRTLADYSAAADELRAMAGELLEMEPAPDEDEEPLLEDTRIQLTPHALQLLELRSGWALVARMAGRMEARSECAADSAARANTNTGRAMAYDAVVSDLRGLARHLAYGAL